MPQCQFLFFCCFCISEKLYRKYSRNCMGQIASTIKSRNEDCVRRRPEGGCQVARPHPGAARPWPTLGWRLGPPGRPTPPLRLFILLFEKTLGRREIFHEKFRSRRHQRTRLGKVLELFPAPCRREKSPPEAFFIAMPASAMMCE